MQGYPVGKLYQAYNILCSQGNERFRSFVNSEKMPVEDIERVLNKYNYNNNPEFKKKIVLKVKVIKDKLSNWAGPSQRGDQGKKHVIGESALGKKHAEMGNLEGPAPF